MKRFFLIFLALMIPFSLVGCRRRSLGAVDVPSDAPTVLLLAGLDAAAENADALMLLSVWEERQSIAVMQIPRDTYYAGAGADKLNGIYASRRFAGESEAEALCALSSAVSEAFGVFLDGTVAFRASALVAAVDALGGVRVALPEDFETEQGHYEKGEHLLSGAEAESFVRYRKGYATGDLGRVEAQKLFLSAFLRTVREKADIASLFRLLLSMRSEVITDLSLPRALSLGIYVHARLSRLSPCYFTLPGEAVYSGSHWYFVPNRAAASEVLSKYFLLSAPFDAQGRLYNAEDLAQQIVYTEKNYPYTVYTEEDLSSMHIPKNSN